MKVEKEAGKEVAGTEEPKAKKQLNLETVAQSGEEAHGEEISMSKSVAGSEEESRREQ
jgi:hypothetical protein